MVCRAAPWYSVASNPARTSVSCPSGDLNVPRGASKMADGKCSKCCINTPAPSSRYCRECKASYMRQWRALGQEKARRGYRRPQTDENRIKHYGRGRVAGLLKLGAIVRQPCRDCGASADATEAHHVSYPYEIVWVCRPCHLAREREALRIGRPTAIIWHPECPWPLGTVWPVKVRIRPMIG